MILRTALFVFIILFCSCRQNEKKAVVAVKKDTVAVTGIKIDTTENMLSYEEQEAVDSVIYAHILEDALRIADHHKDSDIYEVSYDAPVPDSSYSVSVSMKSDFHFTKQHPHLIIRREEPGSIMIDIYSRENNNYKKVLSHNQWSLTYTGDTICDINGDGINDFVVNWYGSSGCCLKAFSDVYLLRSDKQSFSQHFEFINPTFSPKEKLIRGVCYGQPGETEMYKYKWNGEAVDTLEYVYFELVYGGGKTGKIIIANNRQFVKPHKIYRRLNKVPAEYRKIDGFDWFMGDL